MNKNKKTKVKPKVFIIVLNYNGFEDTVECLKSLNKIYYKNFEVILVDDNSQDKSPQKLKSFLKNYKLNYKIEFIQSKKNRGFAGANNLGIKKALKKNADYILLLNNDTTVERDFLNHLIDVAEHDFDFLHTFRHKIIKNPKIGILGPKILYYDKKNLIWFGGGKFNWFFGGEHLDFNKKDTTFGHPTSDVPSDVLDAPVAVDWISGCCMLIKKEVFEKIGLLKEEYFLYYEDTDFNLRARKEGFVCVYVPYARIYHKVSRFTKKLSDPIIWYYHFRNALYLAYNNAPFILGKIAIHFWVFYKLLKQFIKLFIPSKRKGAIYIIRGIFDFYKGKMGKIKI